MNVKREIPGYCQTQKKNYSITLTCVDTGEGDYLKGTFRCEYARENGKCDSCSIRDDYPDRFN